MEVQGQVSSVPDGVTDVESMPNTPPEPPVPSSTASVESAVASNDKLVKGDIGSSNLELEVVQATASFENSHCDKLQQEDIDSLQKFVLSEDHLVRNISKVEVKEVMSSRSFRDCKFTHSVSIDIHVWKKNLWESPVNYVKKHLANNEWKRSNGTLIRLSRICSI